MTLMPINPIQPVYRKIKGKWTEVNPLSGVDAQVTLMLGIRHTIGRASYSPGCAIDFARAAWAWLEPNSRYVVVRDVIEWLVDERWDKHRAYKDGWTAFALDRLRVEGDDFARRCVKSAMWMPDSRTSENAQPFKGWME